MPRDDLKEDKTFRIFPKLIVACMKEYTEERELFDRALQVYNSNYTQPMGVDNKKDGVTMGMNYMYAWVQQLQAQVCPAQARASIEARVETNNDRAMYRAAFYNDTHYRKDTAEDIRWLNRWAALCRRGIWKAVWNFDTHDPSFIPLDPRTVWFDREASKFEESRWLIQAIPVTKDEFRRRMEPEFIDGELEPALYEHMTHEEFNKIPFTSYPGWMRNRTKRGMTVPQDKTSEDLLGWVEVYECYDFRNGRFYHFLKGQNFPLLADNLPYHDSVPRNFYRFVYSENMSDLSGMSDYELTEAVQLRLDEIDNLEMWYVKTSIPQVWGQKGAVTDPDNVDKAWRQSNKPGGLNWVDVSTRMSINDVFFTTPQPHLPMNFDMMRRRCQEVIEFILGFPGFSHGRMGDTDLATEVAAAQSHDETRKAERKRYVNKAIEWATRTMDAMYRAYLPADTEIPMRVVDMEKTVELTTELLGYDDPSERPLDYDYEVLADEGSEHNKSVKLRRLNEAMLNAAIMQSPNTDQKYLVREYWRLLGMPRAYQDQPPPPPAPPPGADPAAAGGVPPGPEEMMPPGEVIPGGELPDGLQGAEAGIPDALAPSAAGGPGVDGNAVPINDQPF